MGSHWLAGVFSHPDALGALIIAGKTAAVYAFLILGLRLAGTRELGQMNIYDLVLIIVLANAVQNAMVGSDTTLAGGLISAATLLALNRLLNLALLRSRSIERALIGEPALILSDGRLLKERMRKEGVTHDAVLMALREHGLVGPEDARMCVLEVDGTLSIVPKDAGVQRTRRRIKALRMP